MHRVCSYIQCDSDRHFTACVRNSAVACTTDFNHSLLPAAFALGTHKNEHLFTAAGQGIAKTPQEGVLNVLQTDFATAIPNGINQAGTAVDTKITCFMHVEQTWVKRLKKKRDDGEISVPLYNDVKGALYTIHLSASAAIYRKAFDAFYRHFHPLGLGPWLDWWAANHGYRLFFVGASPAGLPVHNKICESANQMFARFHSDAQSLHADHYRSGLVADPILRVQHFLAYLPLDGLRSLSMEQSSFVSLEKSGVKITSGNGSKHRIEDIFVAGRDLQTSKGFLTYRETHYAWHMPNPQLHPDAITVEDVQRWL